MSIPIIDLFAGPGGLAEGFSSLVSDNNSRFFDIKLSIEMDPHARQTLKLRSFLRQFPFKQLPSQYYEFLRKEISLDDLYNDFPEQHSVADAEAWQATLGKNTEEEIDARISQSLKGTKNWILIGGPPCQAYSLVGRSRVGGINKNDHRVELYKEYLRIIAVHQPAIFVMENVKGLLSAKVEGQKIFDNIMADLTDPSSIFPETTSAGYRIYSLVKDQIQTDSDYLIKSENYGIPQCRHRVILLGVREDLNVTPETLTVCDKVNLIDTIGDLPKIRSSIYRAFVKSEIVLGTEGPKKRRFYQPIKDSFSSWEELVSSYANDLSGLLPDNFREGATVPCSIGAEYIPNRSTVSKNHLLYDWFTDTKIGGVINHQSRGHLTLDLKRYLFSSLYTRKFKKFPRMEDFKRYGNDLLPDHVNAESGKFSDRFRVQLPYQPATTVTSHISKDGHYFIHYDPIQCRSLTVREAARIQTFPDNYFFCGSRTQQFHQVGNAVPPFLAFKIAQVVKEALVSLNIIH